MKLGRNTRSNAGLHSNPHQLRRALVLGSGVRRRARETIGTSRGVAVFHLDALVSHNKRPTHTNRRVKPIQVCVVNAHSSRVISHAHACAWLQLASSMVLDGTHEFLGHGRRWPLYACSFPFYTTHTRSSNFGRSRGRGHSTSYQCYWLSVNMHLFT